MSEENFNSVNVWKSWGAYFAKTLATLLILILQVCLFILVCLPIYFLRLLVFIASRIIRPDLGMMLTPQSSIMANDAIYTKPEGAFVIKFMLDGEVTSSVVKDRMQTAISNVKYSTLSQTLENWNGFYFWKRFNETKPFLMSDQMEFFEEEVTNEAIKGIHTSLVNRPFKKGQPLWECIVYTNVKSEKAIRNETRQSIIFFRVHQALSDGSSFLSIFDELNLVPEHQAVVNLLMGGRKKGMTPKKMVKFGLRIGTLGPYNMVRDWVEMAMTKSKEERNSEAQLMKKLNFNHETQVIEEMCLKNARRISLSNMFPTVGLSVSLVTGVIRRIAQEDAKCPVLPNSFKINFPVPIPRPPESLSNYVAYIPIEGPTDTAEPLERPGIMMRSVTDLLVSTTPYYAFCIMVIVGGLNSSLAKYCAKRLPLGSVILNTFPGANVKQQFLEKDVVGITVKSGCPSVLGGACCTFNSIIYNGELSLSMSYPAGLKVCHKMLEEFEMCQKKGDMGFLGMNLGNLLKNFK